MLATSKVVVIGGGFGGLQCAKKLKHGASAEVLVVDRTNHHLFQPLLYQVATAALSPIDIASPIREVLRNQKNAIVIMGDVVNIDTEKKEVYLSDGQLISFDYLVVAIGAHHSYFGRDEWEKFAPGLKTIQDAVSIRERILMSFEEAERSDSIAAQEKFLTFAVIGGGPTGVEMAGAIAEIAHKTMIKNFRRVNVHKTKIYVIDPHPHLLSTFFPEMGVKAQKYLEKMGVEVVTNQRVTDITPEGVHLDGRFIAARNIIWAAGTQVSPILKSLNVPLDNRGRVIVESDCSIPGNSEVFVIGDAAHYADKDGKLVPGLAPAAVQQGRYVAAIIRKKVPKDQRKPFQYKDPGSMATIGTHIAIGSVRKLKLSGFIAWALLATVHLLNLVGFKKKTQVVLQWVLQDISGGRGARLIQYPFVRRKSPSKKK